MKTSDSEPNCFSCVSLFVPESEGRITRIIKGTMVSDSTIVHPTIDGQAIDNAEMKLPMTGLETQDVIQSHDMLQQGLTEGQKHEVLHLAAGITEECAVEHGTTSPERPQDANGKHISVTFD